MQCNGVPAPVPVYHLLCTRPPNHSLLASPIPRTHASATLLTTFMHTSAPCTAPGCVLIKAAALHQAGAPPCQHFRSHLGQQPRRCHPLAACPGPQRLPRHAQWKAALRPLAPGRSSSTACSSGGCGCTVVVVAVQPATRVQAGSNSSNAACRGVCSIVLRDIIYCVSSHVFADR